jgi:hypothetical protein
MFVFALKQIENVMGLVAPVHNAGLSFSKDLINERAFSSVPVCQVYLSWDATVNVKTTMHFGLFGFFPVVFPKHRQHSSDETTIY